MKQRCWKTLGLAALAFAAALVSGARVLRGAASSQLPIHAAGFWRLGSGTLEPWQMDLRMDRNSLEGRFVGERAGVEISGSVSGEFSGTTVTLHLRSDTGKALAIVRGYVDGTTVDGTIQDLDDSKAATQSTVGRGEGTWYGDPPLFEDVAGDEVPLASEEVPTAHFSTNGDHEPGRAAAVACSDSLVNGSSPVATQNEPEVGVDRYVDPNRMVATSIDYSLTGGPRVFWYFSSDGGVTWPSGNRGAIPIPAATDKSADPSVEYDTAGRPFIGALAYSDTGDQVHSVIVSRSSDAGMSFPSTSVIVSTSFTNFGVLLDKPWTAVDRGMSSPNRDRVYAAWTRIANNDSSIRIGYSGDHGVTFGANLTPLATGSYAQDRTVGFPTLAAAPDGSVYISWVHEVGSSTPSPVQYLDFDRCTLGGALCGQGYIRITDIKYLPQNLLPGTALDVPTIPIIAADTNGGAAIYIVWNEYQDSLPPAARNTDIYFTRSTDGGANWTPKAPIVAESVDEFWPAVSVDNNHFVRVTYYRRVSQSVAEFDAYEVSSGNGGVSFSAPVKLNCGPPIAPTESGFGDYIANDSAFTRHHVWMDMRNGNQDVYTATTSGC